MFEDLFIHVCILVTFLFIGGVIFKDPHGKSNLVNKITFGILSGILGLLLMFFSIQVDVETIIDLRQIPIMLAALFGGFLSSIICSLIIALGRFLFSDITSIMLVVSGASIVVGIILGFINRIKMSEQIKWATMIVVSTFLFMMILVFRIQDVNNYQLIVIYYWILSLIGCSLTFFLVQYISRSNYLYGFYKNQASIDFLTGLYNVRQFDVKLSQILLQTNIRKSNAALLLLDIDYFKQINDTYGHQAGDSILKQFAKILKDIVPDQHNVFRIGGEEFSTLLIEHDCTSAIKIAEAIRGKVESQQFILPSGIEINITLSIGVSTINRNGDSKDDLIKRADLALYQAKTKGRNKVYWNC